jgi:hypothetical protein
MSTWTEPKLGARDVDAKEERKRRHREEKIRKDARRPLAERERLHVLTDLVEEERKVIETADHKARFALVILGALNLALFLFGTREQVVSAVPRGAWPWLAALLVPYGVLTFGFLLQAIEVLRPHVGDYVSESDQFRKTKDPGSGLEERPLGLFHWTDILRRDSREYHRAWSRATLGQVNAELSQLAHALAHVNDAQYRALHRLYRSLFAMTTLAAVLLVLLGAFAIR